MKKQSFEHLERAINELVHERFLLSDRTFVPLFPWVFVRVLPKDQMSGSIYTPGKQNKTVHEGIVLAVWEPRGLDAGKVSDLVVGDHVLFPHWSGVPIEGFPASDNAGYRVVKECAWAIDKEGGIFAKVEYELFKSAHKAAVTLLESADAARKDWGDVMYEEVVSTLEKQFVLVPRNVGSVTFSGK